MTVKGPSKETMAHWAAQRKQAATQFKQLKTVHTGDLIGKLRLQRGFTQGQMADLVGFSQKHISVLERNPSCSIATLQQIADGLGAQLIIEFKENPCRVKVEESTQLSTEEKRCQ